MDSNQLRDILLDNKYISDVMIEENASFKKTEYKFLISCSLSTNSKLIPVKIGLPLNWEISLIDIYCEIDKLPFIPHVEKNGKLCLFDLEGALIDWNFEGVFNQCIDKAIKILDDGINGKNKRDLLEEFNSYIYNRDDYKNIDVAIPKEKKNQKISYCTKNKISKVRKKNETDAEYLKRTTITSYFASTLSSDFDLWGYRDRTQFNGLYFFIAPNKAIYPPDSRKSIDLSYLNNILSYCSFNIKDKRYLKTKDMLFIFEIKQPEEINNVIGFLIENGEYDIEFDKLKISNADRIIPLSVNRLDKSYLMNRTSFDKNILANKKYLLIGCGSIGGYTFSNLIKSGVEDITLVDSDHLNAENIYRHLLGIEYLYNYKAEALRIYGEKNLQNLNIKTVDNKIEDAIEDCSIEFEDYDYIISATGNEILNRWLNKYIVTNKIQTPVFYLWNEPLDIGSHVAFFDINYKGCYECMFTRDDGGNLYNSLAYTQKGQVIAKSNSGCQGSFISYGSLISIKTSLMFMDLLKKHALNRIHSNLIFSSKGDDYYFKLAGLNFSKRFVSQKSDSEIIEFDNIYNKTCSICGEL